MIQIIKITYIYKNGSRKRRYYEGPALQTMEDLEKARKHFAEFEGAQEVLFVYNIVEQRNEETIA